MPGHIIRMHNPEFKFLKNIYKYQCDATMKNAFIESYLSAGLRPVSVYSDGVDVAPNVFFNMELGKNSANFNLQSIHLLSVDNFIALPKDCSVRVLVTSEDVIHS
jgi:heme/copper-type cytochrome/quinol oxidase subunit 2